MSTFHQIMKLVTTRFLSTAKNRFSLKSDRFSCTFWQLLLEMIVKLYVLNLVTTNFSFVVKQILLITTVFKPNCLAPIKEQLITAKHFIQFIFPVFKRETNNVPL